MPSVYPVALGDQITLGQAHGPRPSLTVGRGPLPGERIHGGGLPVRGSELFTLETSGSQNYPSVALTGDTSPHLFPEERTGDLRAVWMGLSRAREMLTVPRGPLLEIARCVSLLSHVWD